MSLSAPYPLLADVLNTARVQVNDAIQSIGGQTLTNIAPFTPVLTNRAFQMFQQFLISLGYTRLRRPSFDILNLPPVANADASLQVILSWVGYFNGIGSFDPTYAIPQDFIKPLKLMERPSDTAPNINSFIDMDGPEQGIVRVPSIPKEQQNRIWVFDDDGIWMPGALVLTDLRIDYLAFLPDFTGTFPGTQTVNIMRSTDALAGFIAYCFSAPRGDLDAGLILQTAQDAARIVAGVPPQGTAPMGVQ